MTSAVVRGWRWWFAIPLSLRVAVGVWIALLVGVFVRVLIQPPDAQSVVPIYLLAGEQWRTGGTLYHKSGLDLYRNPPGVAALFAPLSLLPPKPAAILWRLACWAAYLAGVRSLVRDLLPPLVAWRRAVVWTAAAVLALPAVNNGQINLMIVAAGLLGAGAAARQRWWAAAGWLAFAGWFKVYPLAVGLLAVLVAPRQLGWRLAVTTAAVCAAPFLLQDPAYVWDRHLEFADEMRRDDRTTSYSLTRAPRDWTITPRLWFDVVVPRTVQQSVALIAAAGLAVVVWAAGRRTLLDTSPREGEVKSPLGTAVPRLSPSPFLPPLLLGLLWIVLFGPATEMNTYAVLAPVAGAVAVGSRSRWVSACGWAACGVLLAAVVRGSFPSDAPYKLMEIQPLAAMLLLAGALGWTWQQSPRSADRGLSQSHPG
jgi:hypothetical protein